MDYCSTASELMESLDYLSLPVKRSSSFDKDSNLCEDPRTRLLRDYRKKVSHKTQTTQSLHQCNDSFILNSTKEEIVEYYAFVSSSENAPSSKFLAYLKSEEIPSQIKDQSLIKVTVAPKIIKPHNPNVFTRRKQKNKHIHSTVSDEDHSGQTKNVYLVVSGQKKEKRYKIKTTKSARLLNDIDKLNDDISLEQVKNVKQLIHSLTMDKKRKKGGVVNKEKRRIGSPAKPKEAAKKEANTQKCKNDNEDKREENDNQTKQAHSIVRITGQIGLGLNNQLLMRCGVEGREAPTNVEFKSYPSPHFHNTETLLHTVTQGTQMDMEIINAQKENTQRNRAPYHTERLACLCKNINDIHQFDNTLRDHNEAERRQNPLVVITVYPNDERCENVKIYKQTGRSSPVNMYPGYSDVNCLHETHHFTANNKYYSNGSDLGLADGAEWLRPRSVSKLLRENELKNARHSSPPASPRSHSQSTSSSQGKKRQGVKNKNTNKSAPKAKTINPARSPRTQSPNKNSVQNIKQQGIDKNTQRKSKVDHKFLNSSIRVPRNRSPRSQSPSSLSPGSRSPSAHSDQNTKRKEKESQRKKGIESKQRDFKKSVKEENDTKLANLTSAGTNTDHTWTKRALVESFTKEVLNQMERKKKVNNPKMNESQVTVNIDGDNENYDMLFQQGGRTTDVRVRKTIKRPPVRRSYQNPGFDNIMKDYPGFDDIMKESSLTNLLDAQNIRITDYEYESTTTKNETSIVPEIKVRDSIEIGHKRQHSPRLTLENTMDNFPDVQAMASDTDSFAPVRHYQDDDCPISDPFKKDKEIRHLLSIEKQSKKSPPMPSFKMPDPGQHSPHHEEKTRMKKEVTSQYTESLKHQTHQINFQIAPIKKTVGTQYEPENVLQCPFSRKILLNQNLKVLLELEKLTEEKPIMLSRKQYHKVKRAIEHKISKHPKQKLEKAKRSAGAFCDFKQKEKVLTEKGDHAKSPNNNAVNPNPLYAYKDTAVLFTADFKKKKESTRHSVSSKDVHLSYFKPLNESSTKVAVGSAYSHSIHTIFRGFRKPRTPNLGTSTCSFFSRDSNEFYETPVKHFKVPLEKPKKPFLRRLMSCLVLRASTTSGPIIAAPPKPKASYNSCTVDSYHISTSLAALEMSSSIYDTSESFYSNHSILPVNNKIKRSFFGSVRGLLTYGRN